MTIWSFDRWVNDNDIPPSFEYGKGWWDYVELVRRFADHVEAVEVRVVGHYHVDTPPSCERLPNAGCRDRGERCQVRSTL